ncbi:MAG: hypothetical protein JW801_05865 [Bacteroidales bacterium]|nr:hypothetical protein [Bacteroidales bacterium]
MSRKLLIILISFLLIAGIGGFLAYRMVFQDAPLSVENEKADFVISAAALVSAFETNESQAMKRYGGKIIEVHGEIDEITIKETSTTIVLKSPEDLFGVLCTFDSSVANAGSFRKGSAITVKGICNGYLTDVALNKCSLIK